MRAPVVEIADIFGQTFCKWRSLNMETWSRHSVLTDLTQRSAMALARGDLNGVRNCNTNIAHLTIECGTVTAVAVMNEKSWRLAQRSIRAFC
jgi:hypothetical protein